jgi:hypothetical protein
MLSEPEPGTRRPRRYPTVLPVLLIACSAVPATADDGVKLSGRLAFGAVYRMEAPDPSLMTSYNAAAIGLTGTGMGANADDGNLNYARHDAVSRALLGALELRYGRGDLRGLARLTAWHDFALSNDGRPWGNSINGYAAGQPLGDAGTDRLSRFSGAALGEAWLEQSLRLGDVKLTGRAGRQVAPWSERGAALETIGARDYSALRRAGSTPQETRIASPMLFGRVEFTPALAMEAFAQSFRPSAVDVCGTFWSVTDYASLGCNLAMVGPPAGANDRARALLNAGLLREGTYEPHSPNRGLGLLWAPPGGATELGLFYARYGWRMPLPSLRRSTRPSPALVVGNPDGKNMTYLIDYPDNRALAALSLSHRFGATTVGAELSYRADVPFLISPADVMPAFMNPTAPSLVRARADATAPGAVFPGYDLYGMAQLQLTLQRRWTVFGLPLAASAEVLGKHTPGLPPPDVIRYGRSDLYGTGPIKGVCTVTTGDAARQCSLLGYHTAHAWGYRLRLEMKQLQLASGVVGQVVAGFAHDVKGWSGDFALNQGRRALTLALRLEFAQRYFSELGYYANWGGRYNNVSDHDTMLVAAGVRF